MWRRWIGVEKVEGRVMTLILRLIDQRCSGKGGWCFNSEREVSICIRRELIVSSHSGQYDSASVYANRHLPRTTGEIPPTPVGFFRSVLGVIAERRWLAPKTGVNGWTSCKTRIVGRSETEFDFRMITLLTRRGDFRKVRHRDHRFL